MNCSCKLEWPSPTLRWSFDTAVYYEPSAAIYIWVYALRIPWHHNGFNFTLSKENRSASNACNTVCAKHIPSLKVEGWKYPILPCYILAFAWTSVLSVLNMWLNGSMRYLSGARFMSSLGGERGWQYSSCWCIRQKSKSTLGAKCGGKKNVQIKFTCQSACVWSYLRVSLHQGSSLQRHLKNIKRGRSGALLCLQTVGNVCSRQ